MREIEVSRLTDVIEKLCIEANEHLPKDIKDAIKTCRACEDGVIAQGIYSISHSCFLLRIWL